MSDKSDTPDIVGFYTDQHRAVEFAPVAGKSLKKVLDRGIDNFNTGSFLQDIIEEFYEFADNKGGGYITYNQDNADDQYKSQPRDMPGVSAFIQCQTGEDPVDEIREDTVNPVKQGKDGP